MREILAGESRAVDAVVLDCKMPGEPSAKLALHAKSLRLPVVMIAGSGAAMQFAEKNVFNCSKNLSEWRSCLPQSTKQ